MSVRRVDVEFGQHLAAEGVLGQHPPHGTTFSVKDRIIYAVAHWNGSKYKEKYYQDGSLKLSGYYENLNLVRSTNLYSYPRFNAPIIGKIHPHSWHGR